MWITVPTFLIFKIESFVVYWLCPSSKHFFPPSPSKQSKQTFETIFLRKLSTTNTIFRNTNTRHRRLWTSPSAPQYIFHVFDIFNEKFNTKNIFTCSSPSSCCNLEVSNTNGEIKRRTTFCEVQWDVERLYWMEKSVTQGESINLSSNLFPAFYLRPENTCNRSDAGRR